MINDEDSKCIVLPLFKGKQPVPRIIQHQQQDNPPNEEVHNNVLGAIHI